MLEGPRLTLMKLFGGSAPHVDSLSSDQDQTAVAKAEAKRE